LGLPAGLPVRGFHLYIFFTTLVSGILFIDFGSVCHLYRTCWCSSNNTQISVQEVAGTNLGYFTWISSWISSVPPSASSQRKFLKICYHRLLQYPCLLTSHNYLSISTLCNFRSFHRVVK
jgi:hypothetical protein